MQDQQMLWTDSPPEDESQTEQRGYQCKFCAKGRGLERVWKGARSYRICVTCLRRWFPGWRRDRLESWRHDQRIGGPRARKGRRGRKKSEQSLPEVEQLRMW